MTRIRTIPAPNKSEVCWTMVYSYWNLNGEQIQYHLSLVKPKKEPFVTLSFTKAGEAVSMPNGILITNYTEEWALFRSTPEQPGVELLAIPLEAGFKVLYQGQPLASAPPNICSKDDLVHYEFKKYD